MSDKTDELLAHIAGADYAMDKGVRHLLTQLKQATQPVLAGSTKTGDPLLLLDPAQYSLGYSYILASRLAADKPDLSVLLPALSTFCLQLNPHAFALGGADSLHAICRAAFRMVEKCIPGRFAVLVQPFAEATRRLSSGTRPSDQFAHSADTDAVLTPFHAWLLRAAIQAKMYRQALPCVSRHVSHFDPALECRIQDFLSYYYYAGMVFAGLKKWPQSLDAFALAVSAPAQGASAIMVEAHKKYVLASLIAHGKVRPLAKTTSAIVHKAAKAKLGAYTEFATAFESGSASRVAAEYRKARDTFIRDGNDGLANQAIKCLTTRSIAKLTQTYVTLSLDDIGKHVGIARSGAGTGAGAGAAGGAGTEGGGSHGGAGAHGRQPSGPPGAGAASNITTTPTDATPPAPTLLSTDVEHLLLHMVSTSQVSAVIDHRRGSADASSSVAVAGSSSSAPAAAGQGGMVQFLDSDESYSSLAATAQLQTLLTSTLRMSNSVREMDRSVHASREYLGKMVGAGRGFVLGPGGGFGGGASGLEDEMVLEEVDVRMGGYM
ncbi:hypothetical protein M427DRAFT_159499 [Gonapodya prolifera JEL478]|uniref:COP9 signalosome complex subunit 3 N-terminal helical repeats domain-containing protein n=1 Tax=Gonapodya prolifera (strain JEL478) TaxID=1344416 RepID=A0A139A0L2_GONPJ|nr:hypothetical protein M427DRAFT_159499 [Gonapodya prolifera JEL478]|eukprot:KXS10310.1 hypothetical protein M427DRAFT_159499 [Gonapodya prolifera JEL478]